jgi:hypothetical protein
MFLGSMVKIATLLAIDREFIRLYSNKAMILLLQAFLACDGNTNVQVIYKYLHHNIHNPIVCYYRPCVLPLFFPIDMFASVTLFLA